MPRQRSGLRRRIEEQKKRDEERRGRESRGEIKECAGRLYLEPRG